MTRKHDVAAATIAVIIVCLIMAFTSGCGQPQQKQWGTGNPPDSWIETFGNDNGARLDWMQSQIIDKLALRVRTLEINQYVPDPNGVK